MVEEAASDWQEGLFHWLCRHLRPVGFTIFFCASPEESGVFRRDDPEVTDVGDIDDVPGARMGLYGITIGESAAVFDRLQFVPGDAVLPFTIPIQFGAEDREPCKITMEYLDEEFPGPEHRGGLPGEGLSEGRPQRARYLDKLPAGVLLILLVQKAPHVSESFAIHGESNAEALGDAAMDGVIRERPELLERIALEDRQHRTSSTTRPLRDRGREMNPLIVSAAEQARKIMCSSRDSAQAAREALAVLLRVATPNVWQNEDLEKRGCLEALASLSVENPPADLDLTIIEAIRTLLGLEK